jgi:hypothetical protein
MIFWGLFNVSAVIHVNFLDLRRKVVRKLFNIYLVDLTDADLYQARNLDFCGSFRSRSRLNIGRGLPYLDYVEDTICDTKQ